MSSKIKSNLWRITFLALALAGPAVAALKEGDTLPELRAGQVDGAVPALAGKVVLLDFWASWCGPCKKSFPELEKLHRAFKDRGLVVLGVSVDRDAAAMRKFLESHVVSFPVVRDRDQVLVGAAGIESMPTSFLIDRSGKIRSVHNGFHGEKTLREMTQIIEKLLDEK